MARLRKKDRWFDQAQAMIEGVSLAKAAERCGVHPTTAYRWRHRFLSAPALDKPQMLRGIVEADETFILESFKGRRSGLTRKARKRGGKARHPGAFSDNIPVLVARDRSGATTDAVLPEDTAVCITQALASAMSPLTCWSATAAGLCALSPDAPKFPSAWFPLRESRCPASPISTSTTSMPTIRVSRSGCAASTASPPGTCPTIRARAALSKPLLKQIPKPGCSQPSAKGAYQQLTL